MDNSKRLYYLDNARGLSILCVMIGHIYSGDNALITWIYSFHVPLFFIISGALLYYKNIVNKNFFDLTISRIKSILIPYIMFSIVNILFEIILKPSLETLKWTLIQTITLFGIGGPTWFLPALFIGEILFISINKCVNNKFSKFIIINTLFIIPFIFKSNHIIVTVILRSLTSLGYIAIGYYIFRYLIKVDLSWLSLTLIFISSLILSKINGKVNLYLLHYNNPILYLISATIGSILIILTLKKLNNFNIKYLTYFGLNSIIIMATHQNLMRVCQIILKNNLEGFFVETFLLIIIIILEVPLVYIINNYLPFMIGKSNYKKRLETIID